MKKMILSILFVALAFGAKAQNVAGNCYRGFVDAGYTIGFRDYDFNRFEINTSHGYQINPYFFVVGGAASRRTTSYLPSSHPRFL